jgi:hypothetical protein
MVGAKGFEPSTSWSRSSVPKILRALSGVAYETERADFPLSVVPKLYLDFWHEPIIGWRERLPSKEAGEIHKCFAERRLQVSLCPNSFTRVSSFDTSELRGGRTLSVEAGSCNPLEYEASGGCGHTLRDSSAA